MHTLYNLLIKLAWRFLHLVKIFNRKMALFVDGRKDVYTILDRKLNPAQPKIWIHCASLGEFEQAVPVIEDFRKIAADHQIVVTFFSPSGFENKKNTHLADAVVYLPLDTPANATRFVSQVNPQLAIFVKYEFWPNYLFELKRKNIPTLLISGLFRPNQIFFKGYGQFMRKALATFTHLFVQDESSEHLLTSIGLNSVTRSGDTRFDRVAAQLKDNNQLDFAQDFISNNLAVVCGSTWPEDEKLIVPYINEAPENTKFIIAPHEIKEEQILNLKNSINRKVILHSQYASGDSKDVQVLIIDCIGLLSKLYAYADIAYVGGAAGNSGLHNILEPATFGVPIIIGKNHEKFPEAAALKEQGGLFVVENLEDFKQTIKCLSSNSAQREAAGEASKTFIKLNTGATAKILDFIEKNMFLTNFRNND